MRSGLGGAHLFRTLRRLEPIPRHCGCVRGATSQPPVRGHGALRTNPWAPYLREPDSVKAAMTQLHEKGVLVASPEQLRVATVLDATYSRFSSRLVTPSEEPLERGGALTDPQRQSTGGGVYLYGDVGVGKTLLLDIFDLCPASVPKRRVHLHAFLTSIQTAVAKQAQRGHQQQQPLAVVAQAIATETPILCLDEFQTYDVANAALLAGFFYHAFKCGIFLVATSNRRPAELLNVNGSLDALIPTLEATCEVVHVTGEDYRRSLNAREVASGRAGTSDGSCCGDGLFLHPNNDVHAAALLERVEAGLLCPPLWQIGATGVAVYDRELLAAQHCGGVAVYRFAHLCSGHFGPAELQQLALHFHTVVLLDVPCIATVSRDAAKQFIILVDELYQNRVKLAMTCAVPWRNLFRNSHGDQVPEDDEYYASGDDDRARHADWAPRFTSNEEVLSFARVASRLLEMATAEYLLAEHTAFVVTDYDRHALVGALRKLSA